MNTFRSQPPVRPLASRLPAKRQRSTRGIARRGMVHEERAAVHSGERHAVTVVTGKMEGPSQQERQRRGSLSYTRIGRAKLRFGSVCNTRRDQNLCTHKSYNVP